MKALRIVAISLGVIVFARLGVQAIIAGVVASLVIVFGPKRLRRLPREVREDGAGHLLAVLASGMFAIALSAVAAFCGGSDQAELASLGAWLLAGAMILMLSFHFASLEIEPRQVRRIIVEREVDWDQPYLQKAS